MIPTLKKNGYIWIASQIRNRFKKKIRIYNYTPEQRERKNIMNKLRYALRHKKLHYKQREKLQKELDQLKITKNESRTNKT